MYYHWTMDCYKDPTLNPKTISSFLAKQMEVYEALDAGLISSTLWACSLASLLYWYLELVLGLKFSCSLRKQHLTHLDAEDTSCSFGAELLLLDTYTHPFSSVHVLTSKPVPDLKL